MRQLQLPLLIPQIHLSSNVSDQPVRRSDSRHQRSSTSGVLVLKCVFCDCVKHKNEFVMDLLDPNTELKIRETALALVDQKLLLKIGSYTSENGPDFTALEVKYHKTCQRNYLHVPVRRLKQRIWN